jgi:putative membrane protein
MKKLKKDLIKPVSICLCVALLCGTAGAAAATRLSTKAETEDTATETVTVQSADSADTAVKDETVYVLANADGSVQKLIVSDWLQNTLGSATLEDVSQLSDIENVKGDETFTASGDTQVWNANGSDIYYQGTVEQELPVDVAITFTLDGNAISADDLAGKSGRVTIRFDYTNRQTVDTTIDGKTETLFVPFAVLSGTVLDDDVFTNVTVTNGKLLNDGDRIVAVGLAFPGLQENLELDKEDLDIPDYVEIAADVENFQLAGTVTVATNSVFNDLDVTSLDDLDGLSESLDDLTDAMDQLLDGSDELYEGLNTLLEKSGDLTDGIDQLADGAAQLQDGAAQLADGTAQVQSGAAQLADGASQLQSGAAQLSDGLDTLNANSATLNGGAQQVFTTLLSVADSQLAAAGLSVPQLTISNYAATLNSVLASLDESAIAQQATATAQAQVTEAVRAQEATIRAGVTTAVRAEVSAKVQAAMGLTTVPAEAQAQVDAAVDAQMQSAEVQALIDQNTEAQIETLIQQNMASEEVQSQIAAAQAQAKSGAASIQALKDQLDSYSAFYTGLQTYTAGVASAAQGAESLSSGAASLKSGADSLSDGTVSLQSGAQSLYDGTVSLADGVGELSDGSDALIDGIQQLRDGSKDLADGLVEFNEEGVQKLVDALDGDLDGLISRFRATVDAAKTYRSFSGISDDMDGQVKFLYRTDAIEAE